MEKISVLVVDQGIAEAGIIANTSFVLGLTAGRLMPSETFGPAVTDGDGSSHMYLTNIPHIVRKAGQSKLRALRSAFAEMDDVIVIDYTEDAKTSSYSDYVAALGNHSNEQIEYRAIHVYGPMEPVRALTKNLSRL